MVTNNVKVVCPKCGSANCYSLIDLKLYDTDLHATYSCDVCTTEFTNIYTLVYLGGHTSVYEYDRDNLRVSVKRDSDNSCNAILINTKQLIHNGI